MRHFIARRGLPVWLSAIPLATALAGVAVAQAKFYSLTSSEGLHLHNVAAAPAVLNGKKGLRVTTSEEAQRHFDTMTPDQQGQFQQFAYVEGLEFSSGVIEAEIAGTPRPGAPEGARGFVGIVFRLQPDMRTFDSFYLRPTNGRSEDQERRNHAVQYSSSPDWPWFRLRRETPSRYERTQTSFLEPGRRSRLRSAGNVHASTYTGKSSRHSSSMT